MSRLYVFAAVVVLAGLGGLIVLNLLNGSVDARRDALDTRIENARITNSLVQDKAEVDYQDIQYQISKSSHLWTPLTTPAQAARKAPELDKILAGVTISPNTVGRGQDIKIKIMTPEDPNGQWVGIGNRVRGLVVKSIDPRQRSVTFMQQFEGREYTFTLRP